MRKNIKITGYYGMSNYGDDLFSLISYRSIIDNFKPTECKLIGPNITQTPQGQSLQLNKVNTFYNELNSRGKITRFLNYLLATHSTDYLMFCGGSLYNKANTSSKDILYTMSLGRYNFHALGVSVGPFNNIESEKKVIKTLKNYDYIALRDLKSYQRVSSYDLQAKIVLAGDLAGLAIDYFPKLNNTLSKGKKNTIGFSPCMFGNGSISEKYILHFVSNMKYAKKHLDFRVEILCLNQNAYNGDVRLCYETNRMLLDLGIESTVIKYQDIGIQGTWEKISNYDFFVSVRLHGAITAYLVETPFFLYEYQEKCTEFLNYINAETYMPDDYLNDDTFITKLITRDTADYQLLNISVFTNAAKLNITENPLYIEK